MNGWAKARLALIFAAVVAILSTAPTLACDTTTGCPAGSKNTDSVPANMLPTYPDAKQESETKVAAPVNLRKFSKKQTRSARRAQSRKALATRASRSQQAAKKARQRAIDAEEERTLASPKSSSPAPVLANPKLANAKAELTEADAAVPQPADASVQAEASGTSETFKKAEDTAPPTPNVELVEANHFNDVDRIAWEAAQQPRLMQLTSLDSRAELRADESKWNQTSTIGRLFVALGALLTIGSAIRIFMA